MDGEEVRSQEQGQEAGHEKAEQKCKGDLGRQEGEQWEDTPPETTGQRPRTTRPGIPGTSPACP